jgi:hypothetical protein
LNFSSEFTFSESYSLLIDVFIFRIDAAAFLAELLSDKLSKLRLVVFKRVGLGGGEKGDVSSV